VYTDRDDLTTSVVIDDEGALLGNDSDGCVYTGKISVINAELNAYHIDINISECGSTGGDYEGVSYFDAGVFTVQIANPQYALHYAFTPQ